MCGIAGIISVRHEEPVVPSVVERMTEHLRHRGPDARTHQYLPGCHLGHTRLSIIDLAGGNQPMTEATGRYWIVFNGEIFNYLELRQTLAARGWTFRTTSDTEVLLCAFQEYGHDMTRHLNGQFAFLIWDTVEQCLFAARDRLGEKPFFWCNSNDGRYILFASEIKALLGSGLVDPRLDLTSIDLFLGLYYVPPDRTVYANIYTLQPGHACTWKAGQWRQWHYWTPQFHSQTELAPPEIIEQLGVLISQAVKRQMVADVPVGAFLSGGLDSSTVVALMTQHASQPIKTFSAGFGELINELPYAREVAQHYQTEHYELQMDIPLDEMLVRMSQIYDEPFADSSNIPTYLIAEFASRHMKVVLSGDGGDELFGGYGWYRKLLALSDGEVSSFENSLALVQRLSWQLLTAAKSHLTAQLKAIARRSARLYPTRHFDFWEARQSISSLLQSDRAELWGNGYTSNAYSILHSSYASDADGIDRVVEFDLRCYLPGDILVKVDRATMAHGLESRAPFLDVDLVEFMLSIPWQLRFHDREKMKYLLRAACEDLWTKSLHNRPKQGFGAPIEQWVQAPSIKAMAQRVSAPSSSLEAILPGVRAAFEKSSAQAQWILICLGLWLDQHPEALREQPVQASG